MPYRVVFTPEAARQLEALFFHVATATSTATAQRFTNAIVTTCERLALFPHRGTPREDIRPGLRVSHHRGRTIIAYAVDESPRQVTIIGLFHGGQDYASALQDDHEDDEGSTGEGGDADPDKLT
jgi:plasmid stabilization system protein ParE